MENILFVIYLFIKKTNKKIAQNLNMKINNLILICFLLSVNSSSYGQIVVKANGGYNLIDLYDGEVLTRRIYPYIDEPSSGFYLTFFGDYFGYIDGYGAIQIGNKYDLAYPFCNSFALVGKNKKYFYINQEGEEFGEMSWPRAPTIFEDFLILIDSTSQVIHRSGDTVFQTSNELLSSKHSGIFEWNRDSSWVKQYIKASKYGEILHVNTFKNVDTIAHTWQGYICIESNKTFSIYNKRGQLLFDNLPSQSYYLPVKILWNKYVYLPSQHNSVLFENKIHNEQLYSTSELYCKDGRNKYGPAVMVGEGFEEEDVALLRGTEKWVLFNPGEQQKIDGYNLFDEVLPSDEDDLLLVRKNLNWYVYSKRKDSLRSLPFRYIHHRGLVNEQFLGSNDHHDYEEKNWSLNLLRYDFSKLEIKLSTAEVYQFPKEYYKYKHLEHPHIFKDTETNDFLFLLKDGLRVLVNKGKEIYQEKQSGNYHFEYQDLFMPEFCLSETDVQPIESKKGIRRNSFDLYIFKDKQNLEVVLANMSKQPETIESRDGEIEVYLEYEKTHGQWQQFSRYTGQFRSDYYKSTLIPPGHQIAKSIVLVKGPIGPIFNVRAKLVNRGNKIMYSNSIKISLCPALLYGNPYFRKFGAKSKFQLFNQ